MTHVKFAMLCIFVLLMPTPMDLPHKKTPLLKRIGLWIAVFMHVLSGVLTLIAIFPFSDAGAKRNHIQNWSSHLLKIFGLDLIVKNHHILPASSYLLSSNHISWMDIHAINAFRPIRFVAKSEVEKWPIFGWMAKQLGTVFIQRNSSKHAQVVVRKMSDTLKDESICIFPEGTSTNGVSVRPFKSNLFEAAIIADVSVYTLAIRYLSKDTGAYSSIPAFVGEMGLLESMSNILKSRNLVVELTFFPPMECPPAQFYDRKWLASQSYEQITRFLSPATP